MSVPLLTAYLWFLRLPQLLSRPIAFGWNLGKLTYPRLWTRKPFNATNTLGLLSVTISGYVAYRSVCLPFARSIQTNAYQFGSPD